jgi:hypothetical protein
MCILALVIQYRISSRAFVFFHDKNYSTIPYVRGFATHAFQRSSNPRNPDSEQKALVTDNRRRKILEVQTTR